MKTKKGLTLAKTIAIGASSVVLASALIVGNVFANKYADLLTVYFTKNSYTTSQSEKDICREVAQEGIVLLKNEDNALPLKSTEKKVALLGQDSVDFVYGGAGSGSVDTKQAPTLKKAMEDAGFTVNQTIWDFYATGAGKSYRKTTPNEQGRGDFAVNEVPLSTLKQVESSMTDDVAVVCIGRSGGESADIPRTALSTGYTYLQVDGNERDTIKLACQKYSKVILIVNANNAMELGFLEDAEYANVKAALWVPGVGQEGLYAVGEILNGTINPSGRLVDTYAYDSLSAPANANLGKFNITNSSEVKDYNTNARSYLVYQEGIYVGYRYYETRYEDSVLNQGNAGAYNYQTAVQFPFGYGMSYTTFTWSDFTVEEKTDSFDVSVTVTNSGSVAGKDVVQIYMQSPYTEYDKTNGIEKSAIELVGFTKTEKIEAGEQQTVTVSIDKEMMKTYDAKGAKTYVVDAGDYYFTAGTDAHDALNNVLAKKGKTTADGMTAAGKADLVYKTSVSTLDKSTYSTSKATNYAIVNQFDKADVNVYESCTYLTRSDWEGTMPKKAFKDGNWAVPQTMIADLNFNRSDEVINQSGAKMPTLNSTSTSYMVNDLVGVDLTDKKYDDLISQLSWSQMTRLVRMGGYATIQIDRIGMPMTQCKDGPSGFSNTLVGGVATMSWPVEVMMAATFNVELMEKMGESIGEQSIAAGVAGWYAPGANIHRSPYSGRNFEYYSEDGLLSGLIGGAETKGVRSRGVMPFMKHFALNDQETDRYGNAIFANEQSIREIYLRGFEYIVRNGKCTAAMASMNRIGATWSGAHRGLMTEVLRNEWGFKGAVITDQASVASMCYQDMISGLWAGTDLWLNTNADLWKLDDYKDNATVMANVQRAAKNVAYMVINSNAVQSYQGAGGNSGTGTPAWKVALICADAVIFTGCAVGIVLPTTLYLLKKKKESKNA